MMISVEFAVRPDSASSMNVSHTAADTEIRLPKNRTSTIASVPDWL